MPKEVFGFTKQLTIGNKGEELFLRHYKDSKKSDERKYDLLYKGEKVELKTDTYPMQQTENFFMERFGSIEDAKIGGPWRAREDGIKYFVYFYIANKTFFWFHSKELADFLDEYTKGKRGKTVANKSYSSLGFAVPREDLRHLIIKEDKVK